MRQSEERHMAGKEEMQPRPKAQRRGKARGNPHLLRVKGAGVCTSSPLVSQPIQGGSRGGNRAVWGGKGEIRAGGSALKLPASFRLTDSCASLLAPPRGSSLPRMSFCSFLPKKSSLTLSPLSTASWKWPGQASRHHHRMGEEGQGQSQEGAA